MVQYLSKPNGEQLAYHYHAGASPCVMFCGGYRSDMEGTKAIHFEQACIARGQAYLRFDYGGHGQSDGDFNDGTIGSWAADAVHVLDNLVKEEKVVLVGSSMGGWMAFLIARARPERVQGMIGIAAAPDFTEDIYNRLSPAQQDTLNTTGFVSVPNDYSDEPYHYAKSFYDEAKTHHVLNGRDIPDIPIVLVQGGEDKDVLPHTPALIQTSLPHHDIRVINIPDGDHRLSRPQDLSVITDEIFEMIA